MDIPESPWGTRSPYVQAVAEGERRSWVRWAAGAGIVVALVAAGIVTYAYVTRVQPLPVSVTYQAEDLVPGSTTKLDLTVVNGSTQKRAVGIELAVRLPERTRAATTADDAASSTPGMPVIGIGDLAPGESRTVSLQLDTELDPSSAAPFGMTVAYANEDDVTERFSAVAQGELVVREPAVSLSLDVPGAVTRAEPFAATIRYRNNTDKPIQGATLEFRYPRGLEIASATPAFSGSLAIPALAPKQSGTLALTLRPTPAAPHEMQLGADLVAGGRQLATRVSMVRISSDALSVTVSVGGRTETSVELNQTLAYDVTVKNLSSVTLKDVELKATLQGKLYDLSTVVVRDGALAPAAPVITWNGVGVPGLRGIDPGESVRVSFNVRLVRVAPGVADDTSLVTAVATSQTVPPGVSASSVTATGSAAARLAARTTFTAEALWKDPAGQVVNAGPHPPKVGTPTQYLIRWTVQPNYAGLKDAEVTATLAPGVRFTDKLAGATAQQLAYDPSTGRVTWRPGAIAANATARAGFQVEIVPAPNQAGDPVRLTDAAKLTAKDAFSGNAVSGNGAPLTSLLTGNVTGKGTGVVQN